MIVDPQEMVRPLLEACPGTRAITTCKCGQVIHGPAAIDEKGSFIHPNGCPPQPEPEKAHKKPEETAQFRLL